MEDYQTFIWAGLFLAGLSFAYYVTEHWISMSLIAVLCKVIIGVGLTCAGITLLHRTDLDGITPLEADLYLWGGFILTGLPMAAFQYAKWRSQSKLADVLHQQDQAALDQIKKFWRRDA